MSQPLTPMSAERRAEIERLVASPMAAAVHLRHDIRDLLAELDRLLPIASAWCDDPQIHDGSGTVAKDAWVNGMDALAAALGLTEENDTRG